MCYTAIPGMTGCVAVRDLAPAKRQKKKATTNPNGMPHPTSYRLVAISDDLEPHFCGKPLVKVFLTWEQMCEKDDRREDNVRAQNAKKHSRLVRPNRTTIRKNVPSFEELEWKHLSLSHYLDEVFGYA